MEQAIIQAQLFYLIAVATGVILGVVSTVLYAGLYSLRNSDS